MIYVPRIRPRGLRGFFMGKYEVTQGQWQAMMESNPSDFKDCGASCPVEEVSWTERNIILTIPRGHPVVSIVSYAAVPGPPGLTPSTRRSGAGSSRQTSSTSTGFGYLCPPHDYFLSSEMNDDHLYRDPEYSWDEYTQA
ncbi:MAG: SUMF1/EgtB/PvdO family nonheme iron enzyme [Candidatus Latescibacterota bacterium]